MAPHPVFQLLDINYDTKHCAHLMVDDRRVSHFSNVITLYSSYRWWPLFTFDCLQVAGAKTSLCPHTQSATVGWAVRTVHRTSWFFAAGLPTMDIPALTALVDRWRSETHTFHLSCGELTVTLMGVAMILGLPIDEAAVCEWVQPQGWHDQAEDLIGLRPPESLQDARDSKTSGVSSHWFRQHFVALPMVTSLILSLSVKREIGYGTCKVVTCSQMLVATPSPRCFYRFWASHGRTYIVKAGDLLHLLGYIDSYVLLAWGVERMPILEYVCISPSSMDVGALSSWQPAVRTSRGL